MSFIKWAETQSDEFNRVLDEWCLTDLLTPEQIMRTGGDSEALLRAYQSAQELQRQFIKKYW